MKTFVSVLTIACLTFCLYSLAQAENILYLGFDQVDGDIVIDSSTFGNDGMIDGKVEFTDGKIGQGMKLTGEGVVLVPDAEEFIGPPELTIMAWAKPEAGGLTPDDARKDRKEFATEAFSLDFLVCKWWFFEEPPDYNYELGFVQGVPRFWYAWPPGGNDQQTSVEMEVKRAAKFEEWMHIAGVFDGSEAILYVDGQRAGANPFEGPLHSGSTPLVIGDNNEGLDPDWRFIGVVDEVAIYNNALSEGQIQGVMETGAVAVELGGKLTTIWGRIKSAY